MGVDAAFWRQKYHTTITKLVTGHNQPANNVIPINRQAKQKTNVSGGQQPLFPDFVENVSESVGRSGTTPFKQHDLQRILIATAERIHCVYKKHQHSKWFDTNQIYFIDC